MYYPFKRQSTNILSWHLINNDRTIFVNYVLKEQQPKYLRTFYNALRTTVASWNVCHDQSEA